MASVSVQEEDFDTGQELNGLKHQRTDAGAYVTFTGTVRDVNGTLQSMTLEHYPAMTEAELQRIASEAEERWPLSACRVVHRYGKLLPGDNIVLVITASKHRKAAFDAAEFLMDFLKTQAPFWKKEETSSGAKWVEAKTEDDEATKRWQQ